MSGPLSHLPQLALGYAIGVFILLIPIYLRKRRAQAYRGFWKFWGDLIPSDQRMAVLVVGGIFGIVVYAAAQLITSGAFEADPFARGVGVGVTLMMTLVFIAIVIRHSGGTGGGT